MISKKAPVRPANGTPLAERTVVTCGKCGNSKPRTEFYESQIAKRERPWCRECQRRATAERERGYSEARRNGEDPRLAVLRASVTQGAEFTSSDAARILGILPLGVGAAMRALIDQGGVERVGSGVYRLIEEETAPTSTTPAAVPTERPSAPAHDAMCIVAAGYIIPLHAIDNVIVDEKGAVEIVTRSQETRARDGLVSPVSWSFTSTEWAARRVVSFVEALAGEGVNVALLQEQLTQAQHALRVEREHRRMAEAERDALRAKLQRLVSDLSI